MTVNYLADRGDFNRPEKEPRETKVSTNKNMVAATFRLRKRRLAHKNAG